jgi:hypothetical protein
MNLNHLPLTITDHIHHLPSLSTNTKTAIQHLSALTMLSCIIIRFSLIAMVIAMLATATPVPEGEVVAAGEPCKDDEDCPPVSMSSIAQVSL